MQRYGVTERHIEQHLPAWPKQPRLVTGEEDKFRAFKLARAALAASGTVTLELALAGTPMVVAYKVDAVAAPVLRRLIVAPSAVLPNLILRENAVPEFHQQDCTAQNLANALAPVGHSGHYNYVVVVRSWRSSQSRARVPG